MNEQAAAALGRLQPRQREMLYRFASGDWENQQIADAMKISVETVKGQFTRIFDILGTESRVHLAFYICRVDGLEAMLKAEFEVK